jgi:hypothetical protein
VGNSRLLAPAEPPLRAEGRYGSGTVSDIDVLLTTEGTYPFVTGGVSTWAHQLITGLSELQFVVYSVVANTNMAVRYEPPPQSGPHRPRASVGNGGHR